MGRAAFKALCEESIPKIVIGLSLAIPGDEVPRRWGHPASCGPRYLRDSPALPAEAQCARPVCAPRACTRPRALCARARTRSATPTGAARSQRQRLLYPHPTPPAGHSETLTSSSFMALVLCPRCCSDELDDVAESEMKIAARFRKGDRVTVDFSGDAYAGTVMALVMRDPTAGGKPVYAVEFDDGERHEDVVEEEMTKLSKKDEAELWQPPPPPDPNVRPIELLTPEEALGPGPKMIKVDDRLRVWWEDTEWYDGTVTEVEKRLGVDCKPTVAYRVVYDDGDDFTHVLGDYPLERLPQQQSSKERPEPMRRTRVTPAGLGPDASSGSKRTRTSDGTLALAQAGVAAPSVGGAADSRRRRS